MRFSEFLDAEWKPALGCTEPAAVAHAASLAAARASGSIRQVRLVLDVRTYKNCHAVGIPNSGGRTGVLWALALGACLPDSSHGLACFGHVTPAVLAAAEDLVARKLLRVEVDATRPDLYIDCAVEGESGTGRAVLEVEHTHVARLEADGVQVGGTPAPRGDERPSVRAAVGALGLAEMRDLALSLTAEDRGRLREGAAANLAMAEHGVGLLPPGFVPSPGTDRLGRMSRLVSAGVLARMSGEPLMVVSLAGSGNKGITVSVPVALWGREGGHDPARIDEALAFACLATSATTHRLGTLSAMCGAANAAGIGVALGILLLEGATPAQMDLAVNTMVGNLAGMICDGAKIGCAMKAMTGVEAAFRAASLALADFGIPATDGIVGVDGDASLLHLGRLARNGMTGVDAEVLEIMQAKL
ncbi:L-serine ammonia-lyase, iron-sulfur-dependent, subunit alpha [Geothrix sp. 21YS21S-4]|uniref:L-serine ammonia-lyase, iron-sulfur-dependent, subunit alpha n=1 Tax=Geothrix sp. 21YS21S-4 TaxID=3068889 RepID=UPI0027BA8D1A|nr:L-serine ammonia-lyase, iron-sulfur-dependent, subunit alpha [Geothrix sp. 21YS21S-4]